MPFKSTSGVVSSVYGHLLLAFFLSKQKKETVMEYFTSSPPQYTNISFLYFKKN